MFLTMSLNITRLECNGKLQPLSNQLLEGDHNNNNQKVEFKLALGWPGKGLTGQQIFVEKELILSLETI